jgi:hypothetical protein
MPWFEEAWSRGILLGLDPDQNTGYRATVWFEYTRALFNAIREGSLIAVRNFSDREQSGTGNDRDAAYEEYSILQIDQVHPWHYAIQGPGERGYPAFTVASAESARLDWTQWDDRNRDDVSRIRCEAIPLRLAFRMGNAQNGLPRVYADRSKPMPGFEARLLRPTMTESIINQNLTVAQCIDVGTHLVQREVTVKVSLPELTTLHFGVFGFTGAGKSNLLSTLVRNSLSRPASVNGREVFKYVLFDLMDEYTGLLVDQLASHRFSRVVICGREAVDDDLLQACIAAATDRAANPDSNQPLSQPTIQRIQRAAQTWSSRITLPGELRPMRDQYWRSLARLVADGKVLFYEPRDVQGQDFDLNIDQAIDRLGAQTFGSRADTDTAKQQMRDELRPLVQQAAQAQGDARDQPLQRMVTLVRARLAQATTDAGRRGLEALVNSIEGFMGSRGGFTDGVATWPRSLVGLLNFQPRQAGQNYLPSLTVVIGENEEAIASFARQVVQNCFDDRRTRSLLYPAVSFVFDEADVFLGQGQQQGQTNPGNVIEQATLLARRGRKFGLGLGLATQRIRYLNTSIMAQPHTYFISKLPRQSDRQAVAEAFAISEASLEQSFGFSTGQWLVASHDATGLKGTPFPVRFPNANDAVADWLRQYPQNNPGRT